jgi:hypothetical protein
MFKKRHSFTVTVLVLLCKGRHRGILHRHRTPDQPPKGRPRRPGSSHSLAAAAAAAAAAAEWWHQESSKHAGVRRGCSSPYCAGVVAGGSTARPGARGAQSHGVHALGLCARLQVRVPLSLLPSVKSGWLVSDACLQGFGKNAMPTENMPMHQKPAQPGNSNCEKTRTL